MPAIDLNSDMGEGFGRWALGDDAAMLDIVTSANVACGFHAGDPDGILSTLAVAQQKGVVIGAHPGYRDLAGFGRRDLGASAREIYGDVLYQLGAIGGLARSIGADVRYVKPHGALYNTIAFDETQAPAVIDAIVAFDPSLAVVGLAGSPFLDKARSAGLTAVREAFADRAYAPDGSLVPRGQPGAVIHDAALVAERMVRLARDREIEAVDGSVIRMEADSICVHGDSPGAVAIARAVRDALVASDVDVRPFVG